MQIKNKSEYGSVLIYVLLSIPVLLTLAAFVINLSITYTALEQAKSYTRLLSLTALEQYYEVLGDLKDSDVLQENYLESLSDDVKNRVNTIAKQNRFTGHKEKEFLDFIFYWETNFPNNGGTLTPGTYYYTKPEGIAGCSKPPCFIPADYQDLSADPMLLNGINAYMIKANYVQGLGMKLFSSFLGDPVKDIRTCAVSTAIKKNIHFVVDISSSSTGETHVRRSVQKQIEEPEEGRGSYYVYPLGQVNGPPPINSADCYDFAQTDPLIKQFCDWDFLKNYNPLQVRAAGQPYTGLPVNRPVNEWNKLKHYYQDFIVSGSEDTSKVLVTGPPNDTDYGEDVEFEDGDMHPDPNDIDYQNANLIGKEFFIDRYTKPEPLTSIFSALAEGIQELADRNIPGDKAGFIFNERNLTWSRIINLTRDFSYLQSIAYNTNRVFDDGSFPVRDKLGIFPSGLISESKTDIYVALNEAITQLKNNKQSLNGAPSLDGVIYIGDFIPNCVAKKYLNVFRSGCASCNNGDQNCINTCAERDCFDDYEHFAAAIEELWELVSEEFIPNNITLNVVLLGKHVGPHTMDIEHPDPAEGGRCLTDDEARKYGYYYMEGGDKNGIIQANKQIYFQNKSAETPFYEAGFEAYKLVRASGGIIKSVLQKPAGCNPDDSCVGGKRREVDRNCETQKQQLSGYITEIVGSGSPFKIVNTDCDFGANTDNGPYGNLF